MKKYHTPNSHNVFSIKPSKSMEGREQAASVNAGSNCTFDAEFFYTDLIYSVLYDGTQLPIHITYEGKFEVGKFLSWI